MKKILIISYIIIFLTFAYADDVSEFSIEGIQCLIDESALTVSIDEWLGRIA